MSIGNGATPEIKLEATSSERPARAFISDGVEWVAWPSGASAYGTGTCGPAALEAVHFAHADASSAPLFEVLLPAGRFFGLYDEELVTLLRGATRIIDPGDRPLKAATRRGEGLL
jgi:hypothetical protein